MARYTRPGVYVREVSTRPHSVAQVATAIPAFIGYTEKGTKNEPTRINSMLDFEEAFGGANPAAFTAKVTDNGISISKSAPVQHDWLMYYCLRMYFDNGGGSCYIIAVGGYPEKDAEAVPSKADFEAGLKALEKQDEPTLILLTDAVNLDATSYYELCGQALAQCGKLQDRFAILDVLEDDRTGAAVRNAPLAHLKYGAAYYPYLQTTLSYAYEEPGVTVAATGSAVSGPQGSSARPASAAGTLAELKKSDTSSYNRITSELAKQQLTLPPSSAMAGICARVDRERGVWKAPANVSVASVIGPAVKITDSDQAGLNVDATGGRSINAIRSFTGKGTLVWGARTLAGNDNEWRYVNVRRLFNMLEEPTKKAYESLSQTPGS